MMYGICAIWTTPVEVRRNGVGAFLVQRLGHKKTYKIETQFLVGFLERKDRDYVATLHDPLCSLMLKDFAKGKPLGCYPFLFIGRFCE